MRTIYKTADRAYLDLVHHVLNTGVRKANRTGVDTIATFGYNYTIDLQYGFPLLTTKRIDWKNIVLENLWFLSGKPTVEFLHHYGVKFWDPWIDTYGRVPSAYGYEWRHFNGDTSNDQIWKALELLRTNPESRRIVISAWNPHTAPDSALPPCHMLWVLNVLKGKLNLALFQRSCDIALGLPYNIAGYAFLQSLFAHIAGLEVGSFNHTLVDAHIYTKSSDGSQEEYDHVPGLKRQIRRVPTAAPVFRISDRIRDFNDVMELVKDRPDIKEVLRVFELIDYDPHPPINFKVAV